MNTLKRTLLPLLLFLLILNSGKADFPKWKSFTSLRTVNVVFQQENTLWVGTTGGLLKYNTLTGERTLYTKANSNLPSNAIETIKQDGDGQIWIGTYDAGIAYLKGNDWVQMNSRNSPMPGNAVLSIAIDKQNNKWIGTDSGLVELSGDKWTVFDNANTGMFSADVWCLDFDKNNTLWIGCASGVYAYDGKKFTDYSDSVGIYGTEAMYCDSLGNTFVGGLGGLFKWNGTQWKKLGDDSLSTTVLNSTRRISPDNKGGLWVSTEYSGFAHFDGTKWTLFGTDVSPIFSVSRSVFTDSKGSLWAGTADGLYKYDGNKWSEQNDITAAGLYDNVINRLASDKNGNIWFLSGSMVGRYDGSNFKYYTLPSKGTYTQGYNIRVQDNGKVWVPTYSGLYMIDGDNIMRFGKLNTPADTDMFTDVCFDSKGNVYASFQNGLMKYDGSQWTKLDFSVPMDNSEFITKLLCDKDDHLWIGTSAAQMIYFDGSSTAVYSYNNGLFNGGYVNDIRMDEKGIVWVASWGGGLSHFDGSEWITSIKYGAVLSGIVPDGKGNIYGISYYDYKFFKHGAQDEFYNNLNSPIQRDYLFAIDVDTKGNVWLGTGKGLLEYMPDGSSTNISMPTPSVSSFQVYPNPASSVMTAQFSLSKGSRVQMQLMDISGKIIRTSNANFSQAGSYMQKVDVSNLKPGTYICQMITVDGISQTQFMVTR